MNNAPPIDQPIDRIADALESIARSMEQIANPMLGVKIRKDTKVGELRGWSEG